MRLKYEVRSRNLRIAAIADDESKYLKLNYLKSILPFFPNQFIFRSRLALLRDWAEIKLSNVDRSEALERLGSTVLHDNASAHKSQSEKEFLAKTCTSTSLLFTRLIPVGHLSAPINEKLFTETLFFAVRMEERLRKMASGSASRSAG
ncbi:hypothetical protein TNCV_847971 [Trichonephila clavipes]|uniref:Uncharacterized protein n=1 Tax=Trichonephila clavipes TaxID=2585209 RepID=A0A8X6UWA6_TRICX|nr:hypothetical protein TNCV_847971 [Trichonephila clavipes]